MKEITMLWIIVISMLVGSLIDWARIDRLSKQVAALEQEIKIFDQWRAEWARGYYEDHNGGRK